MKLSRQRMLDLIVARDARYDGRFITGVLTTGIYCLPSCPARKPKPQNVRFFADTGEARAEGLRPCLRCRPDDLADRRDPDLEEAALVETLLDAVRRAPGDFADVPALARAAGTGVTKLNALLRRHRHDTAAGVLGAERVAAARRELLERPGRRVLDVALDVGFESSSAFHDAFRRRTGLSPRAWRALPSGDAFTLDLPSGFRRDDALAAFGRDPTSRTEQVAGTTATKVLALAGRPAALVMRIGESLVRCRVETSGGAGREGGRGPGRDAMLHAHDVAQRMLGLARDPTAFERRVARSPEHRALLRGQRGLRLPLTTDLYEGLVWTVLGQQVNLAFAFQCRNALLDRVGGRLAGGRRAHPTAARVASVDPADLLALKLSGRKAEYLHDLSRRVADGSLDLDALARGSAVRAERTLLALRGLGPWSVGYLLMRAFGLADCVPVGDSALGAALHRFHGLPARPGPDETRRLMEPFAPDRSLATYHLWRWVGGNSNDATQPVARRHASRTPTAGRPASRSATRP